MSLKFYLMRLLIGLIFSLVIPLVSFSQDTMRISYGEKINLGRVPLNFDFEVSFNEKKTLILGTTINDIKYLSETDKELYTDFINVIFKILVDIIISVGLNQMSINEN